MEKDNEGLTLEQRKSLELHLLSGVPKKTVANIMGVSGSKLDRELVTYRAIGKIYNARVAHYFNTSKETSVNDDMLFLKFLLLLLKMRMHFIENGYEDITLMQMTRQLLAEDYKCSIPNETRLKVLESMTQGLSCIQACSVHNVSYSSFIRYSKHLKQRIIT